MNDTAKPLGPIPTEIVEWAARIKAEGRAEGFEEGWAAAIAYLQAGAKRAVKPVVQAEQSPGVTAEHSRPAVVLEVLSTHPGARVDEILRFAAEMGHEAKSTTIATTLHRLKKKDLVKNDRGRWFKA
jgi:hypothetical protein